VPALPSASAAAPRPDDSARALLAAWNDALNAHDVARLATLYGERVRFYGKSRLRAEVSDAKRRAFEKAPGFHQTVDAVHVETTETGFVIRFDKRSGQGKGSLVAARLTAQTTPSGLVIIEETDAATDAHRARAALGSCSDEAFRVVSAHPVIVADIARVAREDPDVVPSGVVYDADAHHVEAGQGYMHADRFELRWSIDVGGGELVVHDTLSDEPLVFSAADRALVRAACSRVANDGGAEP